jgi:hypothetical protein
MKGLITQFPQSLCKLATHRTKIEHNVQLTSCELTLRVYLRLALNPLLHGINYIPARGNFVLIQLLKSVLMN